MTASYHDATAEPNLTPILDMVFQLITFFMLVINFKNASLDFSLKLPVVGSASPVDTKGQKELLVLNVDRSGHLNVYGSRKDIHSYIANEAAASLAAAQQANAEFKPGDELPTTVVIRADRGLRCGLFNDIVKTCQQHGFRKFHLKAMNKEAAP